MCLGFEVSSVGKPVGADCGYIVVLDLLSVSKSLMLRIPWSYDLKIFRIEDFEFPNMEFPNP